MFAAWAGPSSAPRARPCPPVSPPSPPPPTSPRARNPAHSLTARRPAGPVPISVAVYRYVIQDTDGAPDLVLAASVRRNASNRSRTHACAGTHSSHLAVPRDAPPHGCASGMKSAHASASEAFRGPQAFESKTEWPPARRAPKSRSASRRRRRSARRCRRPPAAYVCGTRARHPRSEYSTACVRRTVAACRTAAQRAE